ncbi:T9SS type A sorting domain-containing protein [Hymenobacter rubidus]|uniref:T9SS type A sorting domain-containing protein n=1 Tax=Hymenobacter rubidus TaxID=1441626 RepID=UPI00192028CA|nr:T9SS type A sorting domain-containing protein [Hymenobacter rubidus]
MRFFYLFLVSVVLLLGSRLAALGQGLDPSFAPSVLTSPGGGIFTTLKQPDGKVLITGNFQLMNGQASPRVARLNADGSPDLTFRAQAGSGPNGNITAMALQPDGKIILGAEYYLTGYGGAPAQQILRLNPDGSFDASFGSGGTGWSGGIYGLAVQADGKILVGGELNSTFNGQPTNGLVRLLPTGRLDASFSTGSGFVNSGGYGQVRRIIVQPDGNILAAGQFETVGGQASRGIVRLTPTGSRDASFVSALNSSYTFVFDMVRQPDGKIVLGGTTLMNSANAPVVVRLLPTGALDPAFATVAANGVVFGLNLRTDGSILVAGGFSALGGSSRQGLARLSSTGAVDAAFAATGGAPSTLMSLVELTNGQYLAAGFFSEFSGQSSSGLVRLLASGTLDTSYNLLLELVGHGLLIPQNNGQLVLSASQLTFFNGQAVGGQSYPRYHRINANGSYNSLITFPPAFPRPNGGDYFYNVFPQADGTFYATYQNSDSTVVVRHVLANGTLDAAFAATELRWSRPYPPVALGANITVHPGGGLLVVSSADKVNGQPRRTLARLLANGALDTQFAPPAAMWQVPSVGVGNTAGFRYAVGLPNGKTLVVWNDVTRSYVDRLNPDGTIDNTFSIGTGGGPNALFSIQALASGNILVSGSFTTFNGQAAPYGLLRLLPSGAPDPGFTAASAANAVAEQPDGKLLVVAPGATSQTERLVRLSTSGSLDAGFQAVTVGNESFSPAWAVVSLQPSTNAILLSGDFTSVAGQPRFGLARLVNTALAVRQGADAPLAEAFPNPAHDQLQLRLPAPATGALTLTDLQGRLVRRWPPAQAAAGISVAGLAPGVYMLSIPMATGQSWQRLVVE